MDSSEQKVVLNQTIPPSSLSTTTTSSLPSASSSFQPVSSAKKYCRPSKQVKNVLHLAQWKQSEAHADLMDFLCQLNLEIRGKKRSSPHVISEKCKMLLDFLNHAKSWIQEIPPIHQPMRFGNKAFRDWHAKMLKELPKFLSSFFPISLVEEGICEEVSPYLEESFGNQQRIDYGTGHELNFVLFLCICNKMGIFSHEEHVSLVLDVFWTYIELMEELQLTYWLEPAGSKGAWGLDDYQFLPFYWGASQLIGHPEVQPPQLTQTKTHESLAPEYLFFHAIRFVGKMKSGSFAEHAPILYSLSSVASWEKINNGLFNMYLDEVIIKFPVVQHIYFGNILNLKKKQQPEPNSSEFKAPKPKPKLSLGSSPSPAPLSSLSTKTTQEDSSKTTNQNANISTSSSI